MAENGTKKRDINRDIVFKKNDTPEKELSNLTIEDLIKKNEWNHILIRLNSMNFFISFLDKRNIITSEAPDWLKNAAYLCKIIHSC